MPLPMTHFAAGFLAVEAVRKLRDLKIKWYVPLIVGFGAILPDFDILAYMLVSVFQTLPFNAIHRTVTHSIYFPFLFFMAAFMVKSRLGRGALFMIGLGVATHIFLDAVVNGSIPLAYPLDYRIGLNLVQYAPWSKMTTLFLLDALTGSITWAVAWKRGYITQYLALTRNLLRQIMPVKSSAVRE